MARRCSERTVRGKIFRCKRNEFVLVAKSFSGGLLVFPMLVFLFGPVHIANADEQKDLQISKIYTRKGPWRQTVLAARGALSRIRKPELAKR